MSAQNSVAINPNKRGKDQAGFGPYHQVHEGDYECVQMVERKVSHQNEHSQRRISGNRMRTNGRTRRNGDSIWSHIFVTKALPPLKNGFTTDTHRRVSLRERTHYILSNGLVTGLIICSLMKMNTTMCRWHTKRSANYVVLEEFRQGTISKHVLLCP